MNSSVLSWALFCFIALTELIFLSIRIDLDFLSSKTIWWARLISHADKYVSIFIASLAAGVVLFWARARRKSCECSKIRSLSLKYLSLIVAQLAAFCIFLWLSTIIVEGNLENSHFDALWLIAWVSTGLASGIILLLTAMPMKNWLEVAWRNWPLGLFAIVIGTAAWALGLLASIAWKPLRWPTFSMVLWFLQAFGQDVVSLPANYVLGTQQFSVSIAPECSGYQGIGLFISFIATYLWFFRSKLAFPQAFILMPIGIVVIWFVNALRIAMLVLFGTYISPEIAFGGFHSVSGWLGFNAVALSMVAVTQRMTFFTAKQSVVKTGSHESDSTVAYLSPLMALLVTILVTRVLTIGFDWLYPLRVLVTIVVIWLFWSGKIKRFRFANFISGSAIGIGVLVFIVLVGIDWATGDSEKGSVITDSLKEIPAGFAAIWLIFRIVGTIITVPIAEELAFRGYILRRFISINFDKIPLRFTWFSFLLSSLLFGVMHGRWVVGFVAGMFYAWAMYRRGKVGDAIIAHATTNALIAMHVLILGKWNYWN